MFGLVVTKSNPGSMLRCRIPISRTCRDMTDGDTPLLTAYSPMDLPSSNATIMNVRTYWNGMVCLMSLKHSAAATNVIPSLRSWSVNGFGGMVETPFLCRSYPVKRTNAALAANKPASGSLSSATQKHAAIINPAIIGSPSIVCGVRAGVIWDEDTVQPCVDL